MGKPTFISKQPSKGSRTKWPTSNTDAPMPDANGMQTIPSNNSPIQMKVISSTNGPMIQKQDDDNPFQLKMPGFSNSPSFSYKPKLNFGLPELKMDPKLAFEMEMLRIKMMLSPTYLKQKASSINSSSLFPPLYPSVTPKNTNVMPIGPMPANPSTPAKPEPKAVPLRKGSPGDVVKAIMEIPLIKAKLDEIKAKAEKYATDKYNGLSTGGKVGVISTAVTLVGGTVAGLLAAPKEDRLSILDPLSGTAIPIPGTPISFTYSNMDLQKIVPSASKDAPKVEQVMINVNVGSLLPDIFGFR